MTLGRRRGDAARSVADSLAASWKYLLSFRRSDWTARDYPVRLRRQEGVPEDARWHAQVVHWWVMGGLGATREDAWSELERRLAERRAQAGSLPRPGTRVPLEFASSARIDRHGALAQRLLKDVLEFDEQTARSVWMSDESSLHDFCASEETFAAAQDRIRAVFSVDVSDIEDGNIASILERIARDGEDVPHDRSPPT